MEETIDPAQRELVKGLLVGWGKTEEKAEELLEGGNVKVNENGYVTELYLCRNQLTGEIPASIVQLSILTKLYLYGNHLIGEIPDGALKNSKSLPFTNRL